MDSDDYGALTLNQSSIDNQDVQQEAALRELETGSKVSLRIIFNELASKDRVLYYGIYHHSIETAETPWSEDQDRISPEVVERIIDWTIQQLPSVQTVIFDFLDLPVDKKEEALPQVLKTLGLTDVTEVPPEKKNQKVHMSTIMRENLPATKDELIALIQRLSPSTKRPASTVRQFLREHTRSEKIFLGNDGQYHLVDQD